MLFATYKLNAEVFIWDERNKIAVCVDKFISGDHTSTDKADDCVQQQ